MQSPSIQPHHIQQNMKKALITILTLCLSLTINAQSSGKSVVTLRVGEVTVTDPSVAEVAQQQAAQGNMLPTQRMEAYCNIVRSKLDEVAKASGRFEMSDETVLETLSEDMQSEVFLKLTKAEQIQYVTSKQNDYVLKCELPQCQMVKKEGGAGWSCVARLKVSIFNAREESGKNAGAAIVSREFLTDIKNTHIRKDKNGALQDALATITNDITLFFMNNIPIYGILDYEGEQYTISCGRNLHLQDDAEFQLSYVEYANGERKSEVIGTAKIDVLGAETSTVKIKEGKNEVAEAMTRVSSKSFIQCRLLLTDAINLNDMRKLTNTAKKK